MCSLYRLPETKNHNFWANFGLLGWWDRRMKTCTRKIFCQRRVWRLVGKFLEFMCKMCNLVSKILDSFANSGPFEACASPVSTPGSNVMRSTDTVRKFFLSPGVVRRRKRTSFHAVIFVAFTWCRHWSSVALFRQMVIECWTLWIGTERTVAVR